MAFPYYKNGQHGGSHNGDSFWTSYSDLFLGLSAIFLLLYVVSSLRTGADTIKQQMENEQLKMKLSDMQNQIQFYEQAKNEYLSNEASQSEVDEYQELMDKLVLLKDEAKTENEKLKKAIIDNNSKVKNLNKYQQMVRNIINSSKFEKIKVTQRDQVITDKNQEISENEEEIKDLKSDISTKEQQLRQNEERILTAENELNKQKNNLKNLLRKNQITKAQYEKRLKDAELQGEKKLEGLLAKQREYQDALSDLNQKVGSLSSELEGVTEELEGTRGELARTKNRAGALEGELAEKAGQLREANEGFAKEKAGLLAEKAQKEAELRGARGELAKAKAELDARKSVAKEIKKAFDKKGIKAEINMDSGEVYLDFGQNYFDNDSAQLKNAMKNIIEEAVPLYAQSLLGDPKIADKVSNVEIIGFASPTYKGRFVDPNSDDPEDQEALKYNMDLSYRRAKSIFNYIVDDRKMDFPQQKNLRPLLKVSGRSFLETAKVNRNVATQDFCKVNDCKKAQRVVIRFSMDKKK